ncbi:MAG: sirohydrochlorin chelatase [Limnohabitans sp.]
MNAPAIAIVLFAHGSRDPLWRAPIDAVAAEIRMQAPDAVVRCAFLELMTPDLQDAVDVLASEGHRMIRVVPMFLGMGRHAREDLPVIAAAIQQKHPGITLDVLPAIGEQAEMTRCMARIALSTPTTITTQGHNSDK